MCLFGPLRVDHAMAFVNRPSVARVLTEYNVLQLLLLRLWISEGSSGFWQNIILEWILSKYASCKHFAILWMVVV